MSAPESLKGAPNHVCEQTGDSNDGHVAHLHGLHVVEARTFDARVKYVRLNFLEVLSSSHLPGRACCEDQKRT